MKMPVFHICGGCHLDRHLYLQGEAVPGRTNPASQRIGIGGVAANIARHLAARGGQAHFTGVQPADEISALGTRLRAAGVDPNLIPLEGEVPGYTAIVAADGELVVGAASMALYDEVTPDMVLEGIIGYGPLVIDANFPESVLQAICQAQPQTRPVFAAATSVAKVGRLAGCLARLDALVLNRSEAAVLAGEAPVAGMACALAARLRPGGAVLVSDGGNQAALATGDDCVTASPPPLDLVRANGAGDAMAAALFWGLAATPDAGLAAHLEAALEAGADFAAGRQAEQN
ncbi:MAG: PfkB family carbohydrate kinase [Candidatus Puniceispirillaceae bacterium]|jgi:sugar/nucleoside kinase (ribokinase family)